MVGCSLTLNKDTLVETEKQARENQIEIMGEDGAGDGLYYPELDFKISEMYFDEKEEKLVINGSIHQNNLELGYFSSYDLPVDLDLVIDLIQMYIKKLNKLKTILEATK